VSGLFCLGYGVQRFIVEFFREPDQQLKFVMFDWMTRGQQLSLAMVVAGAAIMLWARSRGQSKSRPMFP
jgi:phosphatidylglycerol---prolipoprotein diacylglyceryl transferase